MEYVEKPLREQITMLPECIEDYVEEENPVRVIDAFIDNLELSKLGFKRAVPNATGRPSYDPRDLLKLYIYGYFNKIRSSRKLMIECRRNIEVMFLLNKLTPDFRTISDFRKENAKAIQGVFREFVKICLKLNLYNKQLLAIDGAKFRAVNSKDNAYNAEILNKKLERIDGHIRHFLSSMDDEDQKEPEEKKLTKAEIQEIIEGLKERKEKYQDYLSELKESGETQKLLTDPEARRMHSKDGFHCCYNVQTAVDGGSHLIAEYMVTNHCNDQGLLETVSEAAKNTLEADTIEVVADKGYDSAKDILACVMNGTVPNVALKQDKEERIFPIPYEANKITEEERNSGNSKDIQKCLAAGVLPKCFENTALSIEVHEQNTLGCFVRDLEMDTVTCPMGHIMKKRQQRGEKKTYINRRACRQCKNRCTLSKNPKEVCFAGDSIHILAWMSKSKKHKPLPLPKDLSIKPNNHTLDRKTLWPKKIVLRIREDKEKLHERMCTVEHPFGTVKWHHGAHYLLCKGKEKASAELGLSFLAYNLKRAISMVGVKQLIEACSRA